MFPVLIGSQGSFHLPTVRTYFSRRTFSTLAAMLFPSGERDEGVGEGKRKSFLSFPYPLSSLPDENNVAAPYAEIRLRH